MKRIFDTLIAWGPPGVFIAAFLDGAGVPSPGGLDFLLVFLSANRPELAYMMAALALVGSLLGGMVLFYLSRRAGEATLEKYRKRPKFARFERWFQRYGLLTVFIPALIPIPMPLKFFVICAGVFEVRSLTFLAVMTAARIPRYIALAYLGSELGHDSWNWLKSHIWHLMGIAAFLFVLLYLSIRVMDKRRALATESD